MMVGSVMACQYTATTGRGYWNLNEMPNGDRWLTVITKVEDPQDFTRAYTTSSDFKKLADATGWNPTPCSAR